MLLKENEMEEVDMTKTVNINKLNKFKERMKQEGDDKEYEIIKLVRDIRFKNNSCISAEIHHKICGCHFHLSYSDFYPNNSKNKPNRCPECNTNTTWDIAKIENLCTTRGYNLIRVISSTEDKINFRKDKIIIEDPIGKQQELTLRYFKESNMEYRPNTNTSFNNPNGYDIEQETNGAYTQLSAFVSHNTSVKIKCNTCGCEFNRCLYEFKRGDRCTSWICKYNKRLINELDSEYIVSPNNTYDVNNGKDKIILRHKCVDGNIRDVEYTRANRVFQQKYCPYCYGIGTKTKSIVKMIDEVNNRYPNNEYMFIGFKNSEEEYYEKGNKTYILIKHDCELCNNSIFQMQIGAFLATKGNRCPKCANIKNGIGFSKASELIKETLDMENIVFEREYQISECKNINPLPFDFFLKELNILIEYDGSQHWDGWYSQEKYKISTQRNDRIKTNYCIDNNLTLIRIPYTEESNLDNILKSILTNSFSELDNIFIVQNGEILNQPEMYNYLNGER